jgi:integrase
LRTLSAMLSDAMADGLITFNAAAAVKVIRQRDDVDEDNSLLPNELRSYLDGWLELYPQFHPLVLLLALTGVRWGEATSLKWSDVDEAERTGRLCIRRSHWCGRIKSTKTRKHRIVPYPSILADAMKAHRQRAIVEQHASLKGGWCFTAPNGQLYRHGRLHKENKAVLKRAGINRRVTIHGLRRTMTDLLRLSSIDQVTAAALIGHDTERMRRHYSTVRDSEVAAAGDRVVQLVLPREVDGRNDGRTADLPNEKASQADA